MKINLFAAVFLITMALLIFKALGYITIGWFWVFFPLIIGFGFWILVLLFWIGIFVLAAIFSKD